MEPAPAPRPISGTQLRRAALGVLLAAAPEPRSVRQIAAALADVLVVPAVHPPRTPRQVLSDVLRYQVRLGHVRRVGRGVYVLIPGSMHPSMRSRARTTFRRLRASASEPTADTPDSPPW